MASYFTSLTIMSYTVNGTEVIEDSRQGNFKVVRLPNYSSLPSGNIGDVIFVSGQAQIYTSDGWKVLGPVI